MNSSKINGFGVVVLPPSPHAPSSETYPHHLHDQVHSLGLQVASAFCLTETHKESTLVQAELNFSCVYPDELLQDLPINWYWSDYVTLEEKVLCSCLSYETEYVDTGAMSLEEFVNGVINSLLDYFSTRDKNGLRSVLTLLQS